MLARTRTSTTEKDDRNEDDISVAQCCIPIFPDRFIAEATDEVGDFAGGAFVGDVELAGGVGVGTGGGPFAGAEFDDAAALGMMEFLFARAGVTAGFGMAAGADESDTKRNETIAQASGFAGGEDKADIRKHDAKGANQLDEFAVGDVGQGLKFPGAGTEPGKGNRQLSFPTVAKEVIGMGGNRERFVSPITEAVEGADAETTEAGIVSAFGSFETPIEIAFGSGGVHLGINGAIISFLIDDETIRAGFDDRAILVRLHRADFEGDAGHFVVESADAIGHVIGRDEFGMFAGNEEDIAKALGE